MGRVLPTSRRQTYRGAPWHMGGIFVLVLVAAAMASVLSYYPMETFVFVLIPGIFVVAMFSACIHCATDHGLQDICETWTHRLQGRLSFHQRGSLHRRRETPFIEIYILPSATSSPQCYQPPNALVFVPPPSSHVVEQRLQALETLRPLLTDYEYQDKRADIIAMV